MEKHSVIIIGAGPAGLLSAKILAERGKDVIIIDCLPKNKIGTKICTNAFSKKSLEIISNNYPPIPEDIYNLHMDEWKAYVYVVNKKVPLGRNFQTVMLDRLKFGQWQLKLAEEGGANFHGESKVTSINTQKKTVTIEDGDTFKYNILIGADGAYSLIREHLGLPNDGIIASSYRVPIKTKTMYWFIDYTKYGFSVPFMFPHGTHAYVGAWVYSPHPVSVKRLHKRFNKTLEDKFGFGFLNGRGKGGVWLINSCYKGFKFGSTYLIGDAGGFAELNYGEGIFWALRSSELVSKLICGEDVSYDWNMFMAKKAIHDVIRPLVRIYNIPPVWLSTTIGAPLVDMVIRSFAYPLPMYVLKEIFLEGFVYR